MVFCHLFISIFLFVELYDTAYVATNCSIQLHKWYVDQGLNPSFPVLPILNFTAGTLFGVPYVQVDVGIQEVARIYRTNIDGGNTTIADMSFGNDFSLDIAWCTSDIVITCQNTTIAYVAKTSLCDLSDFDSGGTSNVAGRLWIYPRQTPACIGNWSVRFYNTTLQPAFNDAEYTYDINGLVNQLQLTSPQALDAYRSSPCAYSDGTFSDTVNQTLLRCIAPRIGCNGTRKDGLATLAVIPVPKFACRNVSTANSSKFMVWWVLSYQPRDSLDGYFGVSFYENQAFQLPLYIITLQGPQYDNQILIAETRRQYIAFNQDFDSQAYLFYSGRVTAYKPEYDRSSQGIIKDIPCICGFSVDCIGGVIDTNSTASAYINPDNKIPIADPGPTIEIPSGNFNFTLNATLSYDDDNGPKPLSYLWKYFGSTPSILPPVNLSSFDVTQPIIVVPSEGFPPGIYVFILYVSDGQAISWNFFNVTIVANQVFCVTELDFTTTIATCTPLNATPSYSSDPNISIYYNWTQFIGYPLTSSVTYPCNASDDMLTFTNQSVAYFSAQLIGMNAFTVNVTDGFSSCTATIYVFVVPNYTTPVAPPFSLPNYTNPPLRTKPPNNRTNITFPNFTVPIVPSPPFAPSPVTPISVPSLIPDYGSMTQAEALLFFLFILLGFFVLFLFVFLLVAFWPTEDLRRWDIIRYK
jgi:hypothetical protein